MTTCSGITIFDITNFDITFFEDGVNQPEALIPPDLKWGPKGFLSDLQEPLPLQSLLNFQDLAYD